MIRNKFIKNF